MDPVLFVALGGFLVFLVLMIGGAIRPVRWAGKAAVRLFTGALGLFFLNLFGSLIDFQLPINIVTSAAVGFLGLPGMLLLIAIDTVVLV
ncbi:inhibitor of the pro-sigma K processing machinery [Salsuginibacillus halophilus]|uniref:Inhibitor of the pro-sigma K processing machinery n=1 Tax=Salsuginibacillus halophilus TaxID=517424 RepID=A0A2P8HIC0_9BACI|nr:pro-sigmaK processing inhibitor BofA family protein [Salsuginibacillus halophilus]PSL45969.1 inhibitor of the pro-sigma K processing machinery [Salsuginibacillus halophilus]